MVQAKGDIANHLKDDEDDNLLKAEKLKKIKAEEREEARKEKAWYNLWWTNEWKSEDNGLYRHYLFVYSNTALFP